MSNKGLALTVAAGLCLAVPFPGHEAAATPLSSLTVNGRYSIDGNSNNPANPGWGSTGSPLMILFLLTAMCVMRMRREHRRPLDQHLRRA